MASTKPCGGCGKPATARCSRCRHVTYCSAACQRRDWKQHRRLCNELATAVQQMADAKKAVREAEQSVSKLQARREVAAREAEAAEQACVAVPGPAATHVDSRDPAADRACAGKSEHPSAWSRTPRRLQRAWARTRSRLAQAPPTPTLRSGRTATAGTRASTTGTVPARCGGRHRGPHAACARHTYPRAHHRTSPRSCARSAPARKQCWRWAAAPHPSPRPRATCAHHTRVHSWAVAHRSSHSTCASAAGTTYSQSTPATGGSRRSRGRCGGAVPVHTDPPTPAPTPHSTMAGPSRTLTRPTPPQRGPRTGNGSKAPRGDRRRVPVHGRHRDGPARLLLRLRAGQGDGGRHSVGPGPGSHRRGRHRAQNERGGRPCAAAGRRVSRRLLNRPRSVRPSLRGNGVGGTALFPRRAESPSWPRADSPPSFPPRWSAQCRSRPGTTRPRLRAVVRPAPPLLLCTSTCSGRGAPRPACAHLPRGRQRKPGTARARRWVQRPPAPVPAPLHVAGAEGAAC